MKEAQGKWLTFVDADDRVSPDHLALFMEGVIREHEEPDIVVGGFTLEQPDFGIVAPIALPKECNKRKLVLDNFIMLSVVRWNKLFNAEFAREVEFNTNYNMHEDSVYCTRQLGRTERITTIPMTGYRYIQAFAGSAISRYSACCEDAQREQGANMHILYQQIGLQGEELEKLDLQQYFEQNTECLRNIFKNDCPLSFRQKYQDVKRLLIADSLMSKAVRQYPKEGKNKSVKLFCLLHKLRSSPLATFLLEVLYRYKHSRMHKQ